VTPIGTIKTGEIVTFAGVYERESIWKRFMRRIGRNKEPQRLRPYTITMCTPRPEGWGGGHLITIASPRGRELGPLIVPD
jgi:hypothetical protein